MAKGMTKQIRVLLNTGLFLFLSTILIQGGYEVAFAQSVLSGKAVYRVDCAANRDYIDKKGNVWKADQLWDPESGWGREGGTKSDRGKLEIGNTSDSELYQTELWGPIIKYRFKVDNGTYTVVLHFAEAYVSSNGQRI